MDATDATTALTASLNGYKLEAQDAMKIVDQLTTLDLEYATKILVGYTVTYTIIYPLTAGNSLENNIPNIERNFNMA